ncbi:MAG TPA: MotA/TolQ/ExbB proton channel family protein [Ohtaekwangia sp.]
MILLQVVNDAESLSDSVVSVGLSVTGILVMIPIGILLILVIYLVVDRLQVISKANQNPDQFMLKVKALVLKGDITSARTLCAQQDTPVARMIEKGLSRIGSPLRNIEAAIENTGRLQLFKLEKNISVLSTVAGAAPLLGFLGTTFGVIEVFTISKESGALLPDLLSSGMYNAMITTVAGLIVGLISYLAYNYLVAQVRSVVHKMEYTSIDFIDMLQEPR